MSKNVLANGREISAAKDANQSPAAMPDVCLSPPSPPAGPVPIPYPNTSKGSDTDQGSKSVKIGGEEVGLKNSSDYKKSNGDEAATKSLGMGVVSHTIQGKSKHAAWSFDVKIEGANAIRHMDLTTHNHVNQGNLAVVLNQAGMAVKLVRPLTCEELQNANKGAQKKDLEVPNRPDDVMATANFTPPPPQPNLFMKGFNKMANVKNKNGYSKSKRGRSKTKSPCRACTRKKFHGGKQHHSEARIIESIFKAARQSGSSPPLGTLTLRVQWNVAGEDKPRDRPCPACKTLICDAQKCGLTIQLCKDGQKDPEPVDCE